MLNERKLTERELDKRSEAIKGLLSNKRKLVQKYGADAEKVMYGIATKQAKKKIEGMNLENLKELIKKSLQQEDDIVPNASTDLTKTVDTGFSGRADYGEEDKALGREDELEMKGLEEGHGLDQGDIDFLQSFVDRMGFDKEPVDAKEFSKLKKILKFIIKSNILQDKTRDLSKGKVNENYSEEEIDDAVMELRDIVDNIEQKEDEAREIVRLYFPNALSRLDGYGAFSNMYSANRYDVTLGGFIDRLEEEGYEIEDGEVYVNEEVTKPEEKKLKKIEKELNKASKMHKSQADRIAKIVKEKLTLKEEDLVDIPAATMMKIANAVTGVKSAAQVMVQFFDELAEKEKVDFMTNAKFKLAINNLRELSQEEEEKEVSEKLTKRSKVDDFVDDFKKSDAKQFKGKSQEKRRKMAVAAYLSKQND